MILPPSALPGISPSRGEITCGEALAIFDVEISVRVFIGGRRSRAQLISPLEGEMPGRAEGGVPCP